MSIKTGTYITDGTVIWIIDDIRQGVVGDIKYSLIVPDGWLKLNGATINKNEYPRLFKYVINHNLYTNDSTNYSLFYIENENPLTFRLPNYLNRFIESADTISFITAGLPNIEGQYAINADISSLWSSNTYATGPFVIKPTMATSGKYIPYYHNRGGATSDIGFNASSANSIYGNSTTVQPNTITMYLCIKY